MNRLCVAGMLLVSAFLSSNIGWAGTVAGSGYWHTSGATILDSNNQQVRIAGINWYGFETSDAVVHGLYSQDYKVILNGIHANGYNTIRLPFSNQMVETPGVPSSVSYSNGSGAINTDLKGLNSLQIMDAVVAYAGQIGLRVILDDHRSEAGNSAEASGLWYTAAYPETAWIADWQALVTRYRNNTTVVGVDLRNEPHNAATGGSCWDCGGNTNDWHLAAERAGNAVLAINPSLLIFVEGTDAYNNNYYFWGGNLQGVQNSPVVLNTAHQLVYSAHDYGPTEYQQSWFNNSTSLQSLASVWTSYWAYISLNGIAPVWLGEFGTLNDNNDVQSGTAGSEGQWFSSMVQFLSANPNLSWTYWALNGEDRYGLLDGNYEATPANALKQQMLATIQSPLSGGSPVSTPSFTLSQSPPIVIAAASNTDLGGAGDTTQVTYTALINNRTSSAETSVTVALTVPAAAVSVSEASTGAAATCNLAATVYSCTFASIAAAASGGVVLTAIYPAANLTFDGNGQSAEAVSATATVGSTNIPATAVTTTVDQPSKQPNTTESIVATVVPGYSFTYGQQATVNFSLLPTPTSPVPLASFNAQLDGAQSLTITTTGNNSYQIPVGLLSGGTHAIAIHLVASAGYAAASAVVSITVQKAAAAVTVSDGSFTGTYGAATAIVLDLNGLSGTGFAMPSGSVTLSTDNLPPQSANISLGAAAFTASATLGATTHSLNFSYAGDSNYAAQTLSTSLLIKQASLVATAAPATRPAGQQNPAFSGTLSGVVNNDGITASYVSQATESTAAGTYMSGPDAIMPVLADPNRRLGNYAVTLHDASLTIAAGGSNFSVTANPASISLSSGQTLPVTLAVTSTDAFTGVVSFTCTGLPSGSTCSFKPAMVTGNASGAAQTTTLTIGVPATASRQKPEPLGRMAGLLLLPGALLSVVLLVARKRMQRALGTCLLTLVFLMSVAIGCGGSGSSTTGPGNTTKTYNAIITANTPAMSQTLTVLVTVTP